MELTRRRFLQAAGVVAAGAAIDLELPGLAHAAPVTLPAAKQLNAWNSYINVQVPKNTSVAIQCFGFNGTKVYICQDTGGQLWYSQYSSATESSYPYNFLTTNSHGGQIGVVGTTIWTPAGTDSANPGNQIFSAKFDPTKSGQAIQVTEKCTPSSVLNPLANPLKVSANSSYLAIRDDNNVATLYDLNLVKTTGSTAFPPKIGNKVQLPSDTHRHCVVGTFVYYASQATGASPPWNQANVRKVKIGYFNFNDLTQNGSVTYTLNGYVGTDPNVSNPPNYEVEGLAYDGTNLVVGVNHGIIGTHPRKSFTLYKVA